jgi:hypothetical protein
MTHPVSSSPVQRSSSGSSRGGKEQEGERFTKVTIEAVPTHRKDHIMKKSKLQRKLLVVTTILACLAMSPIDLYADCGDSLPNTPCPLWPDTAGVDTITGLFTIDFYNPIDSFRFTLTASGPTIVLRDPYDQVAGYMPTEIIELSGSGVSPYIGGPFLIWLDPDSTSTGRMWPCDDSCSFGFSCFKVSYIITTTLDPPTGMDTLRSTAEMWLQVGCDPVSGWNPVASGRFRPPHGETYKDPRKTPIYNKYGQPIGYAIHKHELPDIPTLTEWGLIIFGVVLLGFMTWVFLKRRKVIGVRV